MNPRRRAAGAARNVRWRNADAPKEWPQRNLDPIGKVRDHSLLVERNDAHLRVRKILRQKPTSGTERVVSVRNRQLDRFDTNFEHVTRLRAFDKDRPCKNVPARSFVRYLFVNIA